MRTAAAALVAAALSFLPAVASGQTAGASTCQMRVSMLSGYAPLAGTVPAATRLNEGGPADALVRAFDRELAAALARVPADQEAAYALTDVERVVEALERCADSAGRARRSLAAPAALDAAYDRNVAQLRDPDFAIRLLRAPRAQAAIARVGETAVIERAKVAKVAADEARRADEAKRQEELKRLAAEADAKWQAGRAAREQKQAELAKAAAERQWQADAPIRASEAAWRGNPSAPGAGATPCGDRSIMRWADRPKDAAWLAIMNQEVLGCTRISVRRDGPYFIGLALGTPVTDEQMAHAAGRVFLCLSSSDGRRQIDAANDMASAWIERLGLGAFRMTPTPVWNERRVGDRRIVQIRCETGMTLLGMDMNEMQRATADALGADASSFVEYELTGGRLTAVRIHEVRSNQSGSETTTGYGGARYTTYTCDADLGQADSAAGEYVASGWTRVSSQPWRYTMRNDRVVAMLAGDESEQVGRWHVLRRAALTMDVYNTRYLAPVIGKNGACHGGAVDYFVMPTATRGARVRPGTPVSW